MASIPVSLTQSDEAPALPVTRVDAGELSPMKEKHGGSPLCWRRRVSAVADPEGEPLRPAAVGGVVVLLARLVSACAYCVYSSSPSSDEAPALQVARVDAGELLPVKEKRGGSLFAGFAGCLPSPV